MRPRCITIRPLARVSRSKASNVVCLPPNPSNAMPPTWASELSSGEGVLDAAIFAVGSRRRTFWKLQSLNGCLRQFASVTTLSRAGGNSLISRFAVMRSRRLGKRPHSAANLAHDNPAPHKTCSRLPKNKRIGLGIGNSARGLVKNNKRDSRAPRRSNRSYENDSQTGRDRITLVERGTGGDADFGGLSQRDLPVCLFVGR